MSSRFTFYPPFRLSVALATGIFLSHCWQAVREYLSVLLVLFVISVLFCLFFYRTSTYSRRFAFGLSASCSFMLLGGILYILACNKVNYSWPSADSVYVGTITDIPHNKGKAIQATVHIEHLKDTLSHEWKSVNRNIMLYWIPDSAQVLQCGDRICFCSQVRKPVSDVDFSGFDYGRYLEIQGIGGTAVAFAGRWHRLSQCGETTWAQHALMFREQIVATYRSWGLKGDILAVASALTVGDKAELTRELKATYSAAGASHVLALSGLHIGILTMILSWLLYPLRRIRGGKWMIGVCLVSFLWGFAFLSGLSASVVRAVTMFTVYTLASVVSEERFSGFSALSLAAFLMLVYQPMYLFDISFQLSFVAVFSILLFYPLFSGLCHFRNKVAGYVWNILSLSMAAQLGTLPFVLYYFGAFPAYFLLANLVVAPLSICILAITLLALVLSACNCWIVAFVSQGVEIAVRLLNGSMAQIQHWSGAQISSVYLSAWQAILLAVLLLALWQYCVSRRARELIVSLICLNVLLVSFVMTSMKKAEDYLYLTRAGVYTKHDRQVNELFSSSHIYKVEHLCVALLDNGTWKNRQTAYPLSVDYVYICRGFKGSLKDVIPLFHIGRVVLDASLSEAYREKLKQECETAGLDYIDISEKGSYAILL